MSDDGIRCVVSAWANLVVDWPPVCVMLPSRKLIARRARMARKKRRGWA